MNNNVEYVENYKSIKEEPIEEPIDEPNKEDLIIDNTEEPVDETSDETIDEPELMNEPIDDTTEEPIDDTTEEPSDDTTENNTIDTNNENYNIESVDIEYTIDFLIPNDEKLVDIEKINIKSTQMSVNKLTSKTIKQIPVVLGESDIIKSIILLPGVTSAGEGASGFNVRGGSADQNLILLDETIVFNSSHLFYL